MLVKNNHKVKFSYKPMKPQKEEKLHKLPYEYSLIKRSAHSWMKRNSSLGRKASIYSLSELQKPLSISQKKDLFKNYDPNSTIDPSNPYKKFANESIPFTKLGRGRKPLHYDFGITSKYYKTPKKATELLNTRNSVIRQNLTEIDQRRHARTNSRERTSFKPSYYVFNDQKLKDQVDNNLNILDDGYKRAEKLSKLKNTKRILLTQPEATDKKLYSRKIEEYRKNLIDKEHAIDVVQLLRRGNNSCDRKRPYNNGTRKCVPTTMLPFDPKVGKGPQSILKRKNQNSSIISAQSYYRFDE
ncbi:unnamed protein product [Moneuplotes crassus]|uniref:Uncharacterized protein n=1 Tax=Euplotes crassus TaxID=5936 RepID=A0AAD2CW93_EUPCR|nr:unnamed protein product [Moneuplotes crassus]